MGFLGTIVVFDIKLDVEAEQTSERSLTITCEESKATVAGWSFLSKYIIAGHEDGTVSQYDAKVQIPPTQKTKPLIFFPERGAHRQLRSARRRRGNQRSPMEPRPHLLHNRVKRQNRKSKKPLSPSKTTTTLQSKPLTPPPPKKQVISARTLELLKTYVADTPLNSAAITPKKPFVILGGGQAAMDVTSTSSRQGKFEARFYHRIFEDEIGRVKGHFGPLNTIAVDPQGRGYASGGEDGYVRVHHFDKGYFDFMYEVEKEQAQK